MTYERRLRVSTVTTWGLWALAAWLSPAAFWVVLVVAGAGVWAVGRTWE